MKLLLASRNAHKAQELAALLPGVAFVLWPDTAPEIPEDGAFFQDNALQKATFAREWWKQHGGESVEGALADDSGLCVDALWGGPGVLSARFAPGLDYEAKNRKLLSMIGPEVSRRARFVCVLALAPMNGEAFTVDGAVEGVLAFEPKGDNGFGYDPIFMPEGLVQTFGELPTSIKHSLSHRGRAARCLATRLGL
ncbi:MAG: non-canonical purine NTP pyrophosphatase [Firmicutes bacterium]|nr:non-canonical purine NTP pyrophosphatase [Bacillota bacterium]